MKTILSTYDNSWYQPGSLLKRILWLVVSFVFFEHSLAVWNGIKRFWLRAFGARLGTGVIIKPQVQIKYPWKLIIGNHCWIGEHVWIDNLDQVIIGNHVCISQGALLLCGNHDFKKSTFDLIVGSITLEDGVWIGAKSIVGPGVICRSHSVLSLNSVATNELESNSIYQGNPAKFVRKRIIGA